MLLEAIVVPKSHTELVVNGRYITGTFHLGKYPFI